MRTSRISRGEGGVYHEIAMLYCPCFIVYTHAEGSAAGWYIVPYSFTHSSHNHVVGMGRPAVAGSITSRRTRKSANPSGTGKGVPPSLGILFHIVSLHMIHPPSGQGYGLCMPKGIQYSPSGVEYLDALVDHTTASPFRRDAEGPLFLRFPFPFRAPLMSVG